MNLRDEMSEHPVLTAWAILTIALVAVLAIAHTGSAVQDGRAADMFMKNILGYPDKQLTADDYPLFGEAMQSIEESRKPFDDGTMWDKMATVSLTMLVIDVGVIMLFFMALLSGGPVVVYLPEEKDGNKEGKVDKEDTQKKEGNT